MENFSSSGQVDYLSLTKADIYLVANTTCQLLIFQLLIWKYMTWRGWFSKDSYLGYSRLLIQAPLNIEAGGCSGKLNIARQYGTARSMWFFTLSSGSKKLHRKLSEYQVLSAVVSAIIQLNKHSYHFLIKKYMIITSDFFCCCCSPLVGGHNSRNNAVACMELILWKVKEDKKRRKQWWL